MASGTCKNDCFFWTRSKRVANCTPTRLPKSASATAPVANVSFQYVCIEIPLYRDWFHLFCWPRPVTSPRCAAGIEIDSSTHVFNNNSHQRPVPPFTIILWIKTGYGSSDGIHALRGFIATSSLLIEIGLVETVLPSRFEAARQKRHSQLGYELMG